MVAIRRPFRPKSRGKLTLAPLRVARRAGLLETTQVYIIYIIGDLGLGGVERD
jgi:hypothetical protein